MRYLDRKSPRVAGAVAGVYDRAMPSVRVSEHSNLTPEVILAAARDFSDRRAQMWPDVHVEHLTVHEQGTISSESSERLIETGPGVRQSAASAAAFMRPASRILGGPTTTTLIP